MQPPAAHANAPDRVHTGDRPRHVQAALGRNTSREARQQRLGQIANEKWLTARQSVPMRERQRLYLQHMPYCPRRRKTAVGRDLLRHCVSGEIVPLKYCSLPLYDTIMLMRCSSRMTRRVRASLPSLGLPPETGGAIPSQASCQLDDLWALAHRGPTAPATARRHDRRSQKSGSGRSSSRTAARTR
jgi:hypothetical protein